MEARQDKMDECLDRMEARQDKMDECLHQMDIRLGKVEVQLVQMDERFDKVDDKLEVIVFRQNHMSRKQEDIQLDLKVAKRDIERKVHDLNDQMETVIIIMEANDLLPKKNKSW